MARARKNTNYNLNKSFVDSSGNLYSKSTAQNLRLWCRMTPTTPTDLGPYALTPSYDLSPSVEEVMLGNKIYSSLIANDSAGQAARVPDTSGLLSFSSAASGELPSAGSDRPFSISLWAKLDNLQTYQLLFAKDEGSGSYTQHEYRLNIDVSGNVTFYLRDVNANAYQSITYSSISAGKWYHFCFTYDGRGGTSAYQGMKIYLNGAKVSTTSSTSGTYVGMNPNYSYPLLIAQDADENDELDGRVAEFAVWGNELSATEISAIYNTTMNGAYFASSGIISNPAKILLQEIDNHTGSYPTIARTGDQDFTGVYQAFYDDTNTINFIKDSAIVYPTSLPATSKWVSGGIATPNILQGIVAAGTSSKGIADTHVSFTPGQNISPFTENRIYIDSNSSFYQTGTDPSTLPNFNQRLSSKSIISIDISPSSQTSVFFSTGTVPGPSVGGLDAGVNSGIAYFNFSNKRWEIIGDLSTGSNVDFFNNSASTRANSYVAAIPSAYYARNFASFNFTPLAPLQGLPTNYAGFPLADKFNATGSQFYNLSSSMAGPFLCEGAQIIFSASIGQWPISETPFSHSPQISTFVLMLERNAIEKRTVTKTNRDLVDQLGVSSDKLVTNAKDFNVNRSREIVWYGRIGVVNVSNSGGTTHGYKSIENFAVTNPSVFSSADLWIPVNVTSFVGNDGTGALWTRPTGSFVLYSTCKSISLTMPTASPFFDIRDTLISSSLYDIEYGGRNLFDIDSGRSFVSSIVASQPSSSISTPDIKIDDSTNWIKTFTNVQKISPFVLLPTDKLILAHINQPHPFVDGFGNVREDIPALIKNVFGTGDAKLNLFGSLLRNNLPIDSETNQPLTSDSIHEDLHYDNPVFDQWDVEPYSTFSGSYIDNIITGSMLAAPIGDPWAVNVRKVQASIAAGQAGATGSLQRFISLPSTYEVLENNRGRSDSKIYDTNVPEISSFLTLLGATAQNLSSKSAPYGTHTLLLQAANPINYNTVNFARSFPFAGILSDVRRSKSPESIFSTPVINSDGRVGTLSSVGFGYLKDPPNNDIVKIFGATLPGNKQSYQSALKSLFCFTRPGISGSYIPDAGPAASDASFSTTDLTIRGFKYGLGGIYGLYPTIKFRRDRYGQFRDILEPRQFYASLIANNIDHPVQIQFYSRPNRDGTGVFTTDPEKTHSQNVSLFSTSSLPYFDGVAVDRIDDADVTLKDLELG